METVTDFIFLGSKITGDCDCSQEIKRHLLLGTKALTKIDSILKSRDISLPKKVHIVSNSDDFPVVMYRCQNWTIKKAEHWRIDAVVLEKTLESLGQEGDQSNQSQRKSTLNIHWKDWCWAEAPTVWPTDAKSRLTGKDSDAGKNWRHKKWETEGETVELHHWLNRCEFEQTPGDSEGQGSLKCCSLWGH